MAAPLAGILLIVPEVAAIAGFVIVSNLISDYGYQHQIHSTTPRWYWLRWRSALGAGAIGLRAVRLKRVLAGVETPLTRLC
ncbi:MAG: hypothetical protein V1757_00030 [Actinomycetota bacterium]